MPFLKPIKVSVTKSRIKNAEKNGLRHAIFGPDKSKYIGEWSEDKKSGKGAELTSNNFLYEGNWSKGKRHGFGVLSKNVKKGVYCKRYAGNWVDGKKQGFGANWFPDGSYYEGMFCQNKRQGFGRFWFKDGFYQGNWKNDFFHGEGMLIQANGNRYEGQFFCGKLEGWGIFYHLRTGQIQEGYWENGKCKESVMQDIYWRQSAIQPSSYPIPKLELKDFQQILDERKIRVLKSMKEKWKENPPVESKEYISNCECILKPSSPKSKEPQLKENLFFLFIH